MTFVRPYRQLFFCLWQHPFQHLRTDFHIIRYAFFFYRARLLIIRLMDQGYDTTRLKSSLQKSYGRHHELVDYYSVSICTMRTDLFAIPLFSISLPFIPDWTFVSNSVCSWEVDAYHTSACQCYHFLLELLIYFCFFQHAILVILWSLLTICVYVYFLFKSLSFKSNYMYVSFEYAIDRMLVPLILEIHYAAFEIIINISFNKVIFFSLGYMGRMCLPFRLS